MKINKGMIIVAIVIIVVAVVSVISFKSNQSNDLSTNNGENANNVSQIGDTNNSTNNTDTSSKKEPLPSIEELKNREANSESDFQYYINGSRTEVYIESYIGEDEIVVIPSSFEGVENIVLTDTAFIRHDNVRAVVISENVIDADQFTSSSFEDMDNLEIVIFKEGKFKNLATIYFFDCPNLHTIIIPESIEYINYGICCMCPNAEIILPEHLKENFDMEMFHKWKKWDPLSDEKAPTKD